LEREEEQKKFWEEEGFNLNEQGGDLSFAEKLALYLNSEGTFA